MMSIWHLLWIVPLAASIGFVTAAMMAAAGETPQPLAGQLPYKGEPEPLMKGSREDGGEGG